MSSRDDRGLSAAGSVRLDGWRWEHVKGCLTGYIHSGCTALGETRSLAELYSTMFIPHMPARPADIYTVRIAEHEAQTSLIRSLRKIVTAAGGTVMINLMEGPGFVFRMPTTASCPLTSYLHGGLLEEGCIHVSKVRLEKEEKQAPVEEDLSDAESVDEEDAGHPGLRMQWSWTELKNAGKE